MGRTGTLVTSNAGTYINMIDGFTYWDRCKHGYLQINKTKIGVPTNNQRNAICQINTLYFANELKISGGYWEIKHIYLVRH